MTNAASAFVVLLRPIGLKSWWSTANSQFAALQDAQPTSGLQAMRNPGDAVVHGRRPSPSFLLTSCGSFGKDFNTLLPGDRLSGQIGALKPDEIGQAILRHIVRNRKARIRPGASQPRKPPSWAVSEPRLSDRPHRNIAVAPLRRRPRQTRDRRLPTMASRLGNIISLVHRGSKSPRSGHSPACLRP